MLRAAPLHVEIVPTHVRRHEPLGNSPGTDDRGAGAHQPLRVVPLRRALEGRLDLFAGGYGYAPRVRDHQRARALDVRLRRHAEKERELAQEVGRPPRLD